MQPERIQKRLRVDAAAEANGLQIDEFSGCGVGASDAQSPRSATRRTDVRGVGSARPGVAESVDAAHSKCAEETHARSSRATGTKRLSIGSWWIDLFVVVVAALAVWVVLATVPADADAAPRKPITVGCGKFVHVYDRRACIIRRVFGPRHGAKAVRVAWCESRFDPRAENGQYRGVFQMGRSERARFGHSRTVLGQALAAKRYFRISGWSPWSCA